MNDKIGQIDESKATQAKLSSGLNALAAEISKAEELLCISLPEKDSPEAMNGRIPVLEKQVHRLFQTMQRINTSLEML